MTYQNLIGGTTKIEQQTLILKRNKIILVFYVIAKHTISTMYFL